MTYVLIALPIIALAASVFFGIKAFKNGKKSRGIVVKQLLAFMAIAVVTFAVPMVASAAEGGSAAQTEHITITEDGTVARSSDGLGLIAAGMVTGISGIGGGIAVAAAAPAAIGATAEADIFRFVGQINRYKSLIIKTSIGRPSHFTNPHINTGSISITPINSLLGTLSIGASTINGIPYAADMPIYMICRFVNGPIK